MALLTNSFEGITPSGTTITSGNSGGVSGTAFTSVTGTCTSDSAQVMHGALAGKFVTSASTAFVQWNSIGSVAKLWFRLYVYLTANPAASVRACSFQTSAATRCGTLSISTTGKLLFVDSAGVTQLTSTNSVNLNGWTRVEGFITGSATVGQEEFRLFLTPDSATATETLTSAATLNTSGTLDQAVFGQNASATVTYWLDDIGVTDVAYLGPAVTASGGAPAVRYAPGWHPGLGLPGLPGGTPFLVPQAPFVPAGAITIDSTGSAPAGAGAVTTVVTQIQGASPAGAGTVTAVVTQAATATPAGAGAVTAVVTQIAPTTVTGAGTVATVVTEAVIAAPAGAGSVTTAVTQIATASLAGAGTVTAKATQIQGAALAGAGSVTSLVTEAVIASLSGAGSVTANSNVLGSGSTATLAGTGAVTANAVQIVTAAPAAAGSIAARAAQAATSSLASAGAVTAAGSALGAITVARSTPTVTAAVTSASTATDPRDGIPTVTRVTISAPTVTDPRDGTATVTAPATSSPTVT